LDISIKNSSFNENTLVWAVVCSILLHILFFVVVPNFKFDVVKKIPDQLTVEIMQPKPPEPVVIPEPPMPVEPIKPQPEQIKPLPKKELRPEPKPIETTPEPIQAEPPPPPTVITAAPKVDAPPVVTVPPPEPPRKIEPNEDDINAALGQYGNTLGRAIAKHKQYPKIAAMRGWQGECLLDLKLDGNGNVLSASVKESSGHEALDNQALEMVRKASPFPAPPEVLRDRSFNITVPVSFKLENP
jgi:protein TonB